MPTKRELNSKIEQIKNNIWKIQLNLYNNKIIAYPDPWYYSEEPISLIELRDEIDAIKDFLEIEYVPATNEKTMVKIKKGS
ncbi:MAG: hypothetical protein ABIG69_13360 [Bacteroidota bacterium]